MKYTYKDIYTIYYKLGQNDKLLRNYMEYKKIDKVFFELDLNDYDLFIFINNIKTEKLIEKIKKYSVGIKNSIDDILLGDDVLYQEFIKDLATKEIINSFQIDGMYFDILSFDDVIKTRDKLLESKFQEQNFNYSLENIRDWYDTLFTKKNKYLDKYTPEMFRPSSKYIKNKNLISNQRNDNLQIITDELNDLNQRINDEDMSDFTKSIIYHYIFEWIHPFYDGNGRVGRLILVTQLYQIVGFPAFYLSAALHENINKYFESFTPVKHPFDINEIDITNFVNDLLQIFKTKYKSLEIELTDKKFKYWSYLDSISHLSSTEYTLLKSISLINIFIGRDALILDLEKFTGIKKPTIAYQVKKLISSGKIINTNSGKIKHLVINSDDFQFTRD